MALPRDRWLLLLRESRELSGELRRSSVYGVYALAEALQDLAQRERASIAGWLENYVSRLRDLRAVASCAEEGRAARHMRNGTALANKLRADANDDELLPEFERQLMIPAEDGSPKLMKQIERELSVKVQTKAGEVTKKIGKKHLSRLREKLEQRLAHRRELTELRALLERARGEKRGPGHDPAP